MGDPRQSGTPTQVPTYLWLIELNVGCASLILYFGPCGRACKSVKFRNTQGFYGTHLTHSLANGRLQSLTCHECNGLN